MGLIPKHVLSVQEIVEILKKVRREILSQAQLESGGFVDRRTCLYSYIGELSGQVEHDLMEHVRSWSNTNCSKKKDEVLVILRRHGRTVKILSNYRKKDFSLGERIRFRAHRERERKAFLAARALQNRREAAVAAAPLAGVRVLNALFHYFGPSEEGDVYDLEILKMIGAEIAEPIFLGQEKVRDFFEEEGVFHVLFFDYCSLSWLFHDENMHCIEKPKIDITDKVLSNLVQWLGLHAKPGAIVAIENCDAWDHPWRIEGPIYKAGFLPVVTMSLESLEQREINAVRILEATVSAFPAS